jgi:hypothetical protein
MRKLTLLGIANTSEVDIASLGQTPRSESDIRSAIGRLENPSQRIADRLFWLHSASTERPETNGSDELREPLKKAGWDHDQALTALFRLCPSTNLAIDPSIWTDEEYGFKGESLGGDIDDGVSVFFRAVL